MAIVVWAAIAFAFGQELPTLDGVGPRLDALLQEAVVLRDDVRAARFDVDAVGLDLAFEEPEAIAAWVAERVGFEAYAGLLRGPQGTLDAGRGNALDVAVLAARLIGDAGYDAEVVLGTLGEADALRLFERAPPPLAAVPADLAVRRDRLAADLRALADATTPEELRAPEALPFDVGASLEAAARDAIDLAVLLDAAGVSLGGADLDGVLLDDARAYAWVRVSDGPGGALDLHPLLDPPPTDVAVERTLVGGVPDDLTHRIRVEVVLERRRGAELEEERVAGPYERPVAALAGGVVEVVLTPLALGAENAAEDGEEADVVPTFDVPTVAVLGGTLDGALAFDPRTGATFPLDAGAAPAAGVVRETARGFGAAAGALATDPGIAEVTAVWLDVALVAPGGDETTWRRALLDRVGPANRAEGSRELGAPSFAPLRTVVGLTVATGPVAPLTALQAALDAVVASGEHARYLLRVAEAPDVPAGPEVGAWPADAAWALLAQADAGFDVGRPAPAVVLRQTGWSGTDEDPVARSWVDVLSAPARAVVAGDARVEPSAALAAGVRLSHLEAAPLRERVGVDPVWTAPDVLRQALDAGAVLTVWRPGTAPDLLVVPAASRAAVAADLAAGRVVIVADRVPDHLPYAWWAVDPGTGDALGMLADGRGGATAERVLIHSIGFLIGVGAGAWFHFHRKDCETRMTEALEYGLPRNQYASSVQRCVWGNALYELGTKVSTSAGW